jgi:hypothetical protein
LTYWSCCSFGALAGGLAGAWTTIAPGGVLAGAKPVETRLYFADYRDIGNCLKFPFRLRKAVAGETIEETNFDVFKINPRIDPRKFQPVL